MHKSNSFTHTALQNLQMKLSIFPEKVIGRETMASSCIRGGLD